MQSANFSGFLSRWRWIILLAWLLAAGTLIYFVPQPNPALYEAANFLPPTTPYSQAVEALQKAFPDSSSLSQIFVIFERPGGALTPKDDDTIQSVARLIPTPGSLASKDALQGVHVISPADIPRLFEPNPLLSSVSSDRGQAAIVMVDLPTNFVTIRSSQIVNHVRAILKTTPLPPGLGVAVSGSAGFGHDYAQAAEESHRRTLYVTLIAVAAILLLVYRAPLAAMLPLMGISLAAVIAVKTLAIVTRFGLHVGTAEHIFVIVLIYGAGVDYSLLLVSRFRESLLSGLPPLAAADRGSRAALSAILAAAATNILGLFMLYFAQYKVFQTTGPAVAIALGVGMLASITLIPALLAIFGSAIFWPQRTTGHRLPRLWPGIARVVTGRPLIVLLVTLAAMAYPIYRGANQVWVYDTLASIRAEYSDGIGNAAAGLEIARAHWPVGEISPVEMLVQSPQPLAADQWVSVSGRLSKAFLNISSDGDHPVADVRSISQPLGRTASAATDLVLRSTGEVRRMYLSPDGRSMKMDVVMSTAPLDLRTMDEVQRRRPPRGRPARRNRGRSAGRRRQPPSTTRLSGRRHRRDDRHAPPPARISTSSPRWS